MATTPDRAIVALSRLKSPRTPSSPDTVASLRVKEAVLNFIEFHNKWKQAEEKGSQFCNAINNIKKNLLQATSPENPYPDNLRLYCKQLSVMVSIMEDVVTNAMNNIAQIKMLETCFPMHDNIGHTWNCSKTLRVMEASVISYKRELSTRQYLAENIGHSLSADQCSLFVCSWNHMRDSERELGINMMIAEFKSFE